MDLVFSQAVLEHVNDLWHTYQTSYRWLKKGGLMSHVVDFKSHGVTEEWNGHWSYNSFLWRIIRGGRPYLLNREPLSVHIKYLELGGFRITAVIPVRNMDGLRRNQLASRYRNLSDEDLTTSVAHIVSVKQ